MFNCTSVFYANQQSEAQININQGGTSSSKTYSIMQLLYRIAIAEPRQVITVTGESIPNLKKGAYRDAETIYGNTPYLHQFIDSWNKTDRIISFKNGSLIEFISNLDEQSAKNGKRDYLFVNEANGIPYQVFWQLGIRTRKRIFIDYNPSAPFWAHEKLIGTGPGTNDFNATVKLIISDHRHNIFLSAEEHAKIETMADPELWGVYARGKTGNLRGIIYTNWQKIPDELFPWADPFIGGLDFGYTNDPTACVRIVRKGDAVYVHEVIYDTGLSAFEIAKRKKEAGFTRDVPIYADHDLEMIAHLRREGYPLVMQALKSINAGIEMLKSFTVYYTASSIHIDEERKKYMWIVDPDNGKPTNRPIDTSNHLMDAIRYGVYTHYFKERV